MNRIERIIDIFTKQFDSGDAIVVTTAPGRVNLIGEHTDYNEGYVLPMAIAMGIRMAGRRRDDNRVRVYAADYDQTAVFILDSLLARDAEHPWSNYIRGVFWSFREAGMLLRGMDLAFSGNLPQGAGLSSSAALEVATGLMIRELCGLSVDRPAIAHLCQRAENEFVGMKCGIMDQFASLMSQTGHAIFLDCRSLDMEAIPLEVGDYRILICHSDVKHQLVASEYNRRRQSCTDGVRILQDHFPEVKALRDVSPEQLEKYHSEMSPEVYRRCFHIVTENQRVLDSVAALRRGDLPAFGRLMNESHNSQRDYFEVSCVEVDQLVELARGIPGVLGARITGGGFGGCTVNLVANDAVDRFEKDVLGVYREKTGLEPRLFVCTPSSGAAIEKGGRKPK